MSDPITILIVDDDKSFTLITQLYLQKNGNYRVITAQNGVEAIRLFDLYTPHLMIVDLAMPKMDGYELVHQLRLRTPTTPILVFTNDTDPANEVVVLREGADDFLKKTSTPSQLLAHIELLLRRAGKSIHAIECGALVFNKDLKQIAFEGKPLKLSPLEFQLLAMFIEYPNRTFSREELFDAFWDKPEDGQIRLVDVAIAGLRQKLGTKNKIIETVWGIGYMLHT